ncbi:MAG: glutamate-1-semialdehyde 2,1-aminomutase [Gammaproteobacteria bacterium]|nr:glutamate-1-semialdehyde 2,1-aminomutase [Gammaproteobacteria bacterium]MBT7371061.1 glutamate-1-semialdehyde 2,1-aminomutase [Gammaproteobacteria bacterium]
MTRSETLFEEAKQYIPGGVNSPVRAFARVGGQPIFFTQGEGAYLTDEDGRRYIDYIGSWGPMIVGHAHPEVVSSVQRAMEKGLSFGAPTEIETTLAKKIQAMLPSMELTRMVNSGTEATMSAIRVARGYTGRDTIVKFEGCYHGHSDALLVKAGSGALTLGEPDSLGVPAAFAEHTLTLEYNNSDQVGEIFNARGDDIAAVIIEPVAGNMGCVPPVAGFLETIREQCTAHGALLIFDEVMTGFRVGRGSAQALYDVTPDLTTLGKIIGGGMPVGAFGGRRDVMEVVAPLGGVYQAGTLSGNPIAMQAGLTTLELIDTAEFYSSLNAKAATLVEGLQKLADKESIPFTTNRVGSMFGFFFTSTTPVTAFSQVMSADGEMFNQFFHAMLKGGINLAPSPFESGFVSAAHGEIEIEATLQTAEAAFKSIRS